ncbi:hypothetical protein [uncultured Sphingomonas sp.]|uniref:hypothetical protein n=1 Tax=uncultured Sphingomonas sp. TaxID=158754 RepID=UPI00374A2D39
MDCATPRMPARVDDQHWLRRLSIERRDTVTVTCTHDPVGVLERLQTGRPLQAHSGFNAAMIGK